MKLKTFLIITLLLAQVISNGQDRSGFDKEVIASRLVLDLQTIVSREISPLIPIVVTVGSIHGGTRPNIIPEEVKMELTLRYYDNNAIEQTIDAIKRISKGAAVTAGLPNNKLPEVWISPAETPPGTE